MLILNLFYLFIIFASKGLKKKAVKTTFGPVCVCETAVLTCLPESGKKIQPFEITSSKRLLKFIFNYVIMTAWLSLTC
jgi:hypothetical protein